MRERVVSRASQMRLRGARQHALTAVLTLLCGWSRITDDRVGLPQVVELIVAAGGRRYDLKTVGRALASLAADELIVYRPAQGRGARAFIAIHDQFVGGVEVLERDQSGRVITDYSGHSTPDSVTFSEPRPYIDQKNYPPTPRNQSQPEASRPIAVKVSPEELRTVLRHLPEPLARLPKHLRWMLGREIRQRLERGWRPDQILDVLAAPMPADVAAPVAVGVVAAAAQRRRRRTAVAACAAGLGRPGKRRSTRSGARTPPHAGTPTWRPSPAPSSAPTCCAPTR